MVYDDYFILPILDIFLRRESVTLQFKKETERERKKAVKVIYNDKTAGSSVASFLLFKLTSLMNMSVYCSHWYIYVHILCFLSSYPSGNFSIKFKIDGVIYQTNQVK